MTLDPCNGSVLNRVVPTTKTSAWSKPFRTIKSGSDWFLALILLAMSKSKKERAYSEEFHKSWAWGRSNSEILRNRTLTCIQSQRKTCGPYAISWCTVALSTRASLSSKLKSVQTSSRQLKSCRTSRLVYKTVLLMKTTVLWTMRMLRLTRWSSKLSCKVAKLFTWKETKSASTRESALACEALSSRLKVVWSRSNP